MPEKLSTTDTRSKILSTARNLFYQNGFQAVGIDTIIKESGIAKMTLYNHFHSKSELIVAYLNSANEEFWDWFLKSTSRSSDPSKKIILFFESLEKLSQSPKCLGCPFLLASSEFPDRNSPEHKVSVSHKEKVKEQFQTLAKEAGLSNPKVLASQLMLLMDGVFVSARLYKKNNPSASVSKAVKILIKSSEK